MERLKNMLGLKPFDTERQKQCESGNTSEYRRNISLNSLSKNRPEELIEEKVTELFTKILNDVQISCTNKYMYSVLRSKILSAGNDCIRELKNEFMKLQ